ncbi:MAG: hypothetical protein LBM13_03055 [Candidatus Ancillula sp.]|jgi:hypothetical protein|nr:hypothetical protein [Candidatus Ancillula sp.]
MSPDLAKLYCEEQKRFVYASASNYSSEEFDIKNTAQNKSTCLGCPIVNSCPLYV